MLSPLGEGSILCWSNEENPLSKSPTGERSSLRFQGVEEAALRTVGKVGKF